MKNLGGFNYKFILCVYISAVLNLFQTEVTKPFFSIASYTRIRSWLLIAYQCLSFIRKLHCFWQITHLVLCLFKCTTKLVFLKVKKKVLNKWTVKSYLLLKQWHGSNLDSTWMLQDENNIGDFNLPSFYQSSITVTLNLKMLINFKCEIAILHLVKCFIFQPALGWCSL